MLGKIFLHTKAVTGGLEMKKNSVTYYLNDAFERNQILFHRKFWKMSNGHNSNKFDFHSNEPVLKMRFVKIFLVVVVFCIVKSKFLVNCLNSHYFGNFSQPSHLFATLTKVSIRENASKNNLTVQWCFFITRIIEQN